MRSRVVLAVVVALAVGIAASAMGGAAPATPLKFAVSFPSSLRAHAADGRVYVIVSTTRNPEPRFQIDITDGTPFWGLDVTHLAPGHEAVLGSGAHVYGYPLTQIAQLPAGDYWVQGFLNVYTTFHRSDGSVVQLHMPCGDGGYFFDSPGNLLSAPIHVHLDPATGGTVHIHLGTEIQPSDPVPPGGTCQQGNPKDSPHVKHVKIRSALLSRFWGRSIFLGANVLLPQGYDPSGKTRYPVIWHQTHFPFGNPDGFSENGANGFSKWWVSGDAPKVLIVDIRHENPYFDDSYAVNSANLGRYGDAITKELMPYVERRFHGVGARWARVTDGGSTGGWEAVAQQVFYPRVYSGAWVFYPDPVDFRSFQLPNVYADPNAYVTRHQWVDVPRTSAREVSGDPIWTMEQENDWELALGTHGRSQLGQWDIWQAVYGPQGSDGYPAPIWNKVTGAIDHSVAAAWAPKDLRRYLQANWPTIGRLLAGRLRFFVGDDDTFFLDNAVERLQASTRLLHDPAPGWTFTYGHNEPHGWSPYTTEQLVRMEAAYMAGHAPAGTDTSSWVGSAAAGPAVPGGVVAPAGPRGGLRPGS